MEDPAILLKQALDKIRHQTTSNLVHQKRPATLLIALEATLTEQGTALTPVAYFAALWSTITQLVGSAAASSGGATPASAAGAAADSDAEETLAAALYLFAIVLPCTPPPVLRTRTSSILELLGAQIASLQEQAPALKSLLTILQAVYLNMDASSLNQLQAKQAFNSILLLLIDNRPKVRRKAQEVITAILGNPPAPSVKHPYASRIADFVLESLKEALREGRKGGKRKQQDQGGPSEEVSRAIALCAFIKSVGKDWPADVIAPLCSLLLSLPRLGNPFLTSASYDILETLFSKSSDSFEEGKVEETLEAVLAAKPAGSGSVDERILPGWLGTVEHGFVAFARTNPTNCTRSLLSTFNGVLHYLSSPAPAVRAAATSTLTALLRYCVSPEEIEYTVFNPHDEDDRDHPLKAICDNLLGAMKSIKYQAAAMPHLLAVVSALLSKLRVRVSSGLKKDKQKTPAAGYLVAEHVKLAGHMRGIDGFEYRDAAESVIGTATEVCGPEWVLDLLPLNLEGKSNEGGRAWLLPIFKTKITNTSLKHFTTYFVPLSEVMYGKYRDAEMKSENKDLPLTDAERKRAGIEAKVYEAVVQQIWALFPGYCDLPVDLTEAFTKQFCEILSNVLYTQAHLRPPVFRGLQLLVERNRSIMASGSPAEVLLETFGVDSVTGKQNLDLLASLAPNLLAVMFNVFSKAGKEGRGYVLDCISAYLSILTKKDLIGTYTKIQTLLVNALKGPEVKVAPGESTVPQTMLDFLIQLVPYLPDTETATSLLKLVLSKEVLQNKDTSVQKKAYRALVRLCESGGQAGEKVIKDNMEEIVEELVEKNTNVAAAAKKDRIVLLSTLIPILPSDKLHIIPSIIPEAVLSTKEANEVARGAAYDLLVRMAERMQQGGVIKRGLLKGDGEDDDDEDMDDEAEASLQEYITMVAAGLVGQTPHMISATITALSRLLFEYHSQMTSETINELLATILVFLGSANREIVKSSVGFVKVAIVALPPVNVQPHLSKLVPALFSWSHEHRNHFKLNIRHIFERLIRKFGYEEIEALVEEDDRKLLANIRKRQQRAKRKQQAREDGDASDADQASRPQANRNAYEDALYGSEDDDDESDADEGIRKPNAAANGKGKAQQQQGQQLRKNAIGRRKEQTQQTNAAYIQDLGEDPLDLLDEKMLGKISRTNPEAAAALQAKRQKAIASGYKTDSKTGKMIFDDDDADDNNGRAGGLHDDMPMDSTNAYLEAISGEDGHTRDAKGRIKFNKPSKRTRAQLEEDELVETVKDRLADLGMAREDGGVDGARPKKQPKKKQPKERIGAEFRAKKAGGDVKRADGPNPYAYVPLGNGKKKGNLSIVNKGKQRR